MKKKHILFKDIKDEDLIQEENYAIRKYALESFAREVDDKTQQQLFTRLLLDYTAITREREELYQELARNKEKLEKYSLYLEELVEEKINEISNSQIATIYALIKLSESRDDETGTHIERTAGFCQLLAEKAQKISLYLEEINDAFIQTIYKASPLHDIGKVGIPDHILLKPGRLTEEEFEIMKTHVQVGYETLAKVEVQYNQNAFLKMGMDIALYHHEKWNGTGYLKGLSGEEIPLAARIMAIADVYDALRSKRVYKDAFSHDKSLEIILSGKGTHFDPKLVEVFIQFHEEFQRLYHSIQ